MIPAVTKHVRDAYDPPALQLTEAGAHVGPSHRPGVCDFLGMQRLWLNEQQSMHLGYRTIDSPTCAHFAPVQDEFLFDRCERHNDFCYFCLYRIYRTNNTLTRPSAA